jgi:hypothetical protein
MAFLDLGDLAGDILEGILRFLKEKYPWYPPCEGAVMTSCHSGWGCYEGRVSFVDTVTWTCPDGSTMTKTGASIVTDQHCE